jgi:hypothetical protein
MIKVMNAIHRRVNSYAHYIETKCSERTIIYTFKDTQKECSVTDYKRI